MQWRYLHLASGREVTSLLDLARDCDLDAGGVADLLGYGHPVGSRTLLSGVEGRTQTWTLPRPDPHPDELGTTAARRDRLWQLLRAAVARAASGAEAPRITLSGGLDSRALAAAAAAEGIAGLDCATFGDPDCEDIPAAAEIARRLGLPHTITELTADAALQNESRTFEATGGFGGAASAPGAQTDEAWADQCDRILSGMSGEAVWGQLGVPGPSPPARMRKLGVSVPPLEAALAAPPPPAWVPADSHPAWVNLHTRQARGTANGIRSRLHHTPLVPVPWDPELLAFCLALPTGDRCDRALLRQVLEHHAPAVAPSAIPPVRGPVHDLDRAMGTDPGWRRALTGMIAGSRDRSWRHLGLRPRIVRRLVRQVLDGKRRRAVFVSRLRVLVLWESYHGDRVPRDR